MALAAKSSAVQIKAEVTEGLDPGSWTSADVLAASALSESLNFDQQALNEFGGSLDQGETVAGAPKPVLTIRGALRGSGTVATAIAPFSALMKAAMFAESIQPVLPAAATFAATAGTANTITVLGTGTPGTELPDAAAEAADPGKLVGCVVELGGNVSPTTWAVIIGYSVVTTNRVFTLSRSALECGVGGAAFTAATTLKVLPGMLWKAATPSPQPSCYVRQFRGPGSSSVCQSFAGSRTNYRQTVRAGTFAEFEFATGGQFIGRSAVTLPAAPVFLSPPIGVNSTCHFTGGAITAGKLEMQELSIDTGNTGQYPDDINQLTGVQPYIMGSRKITGSVNPLLTDVPTRNIVTEIQAGTKGALTVSIGPKTSYSAATGNRFAWTLPNAKFLDASITEDNIVLREALTFEATSFNNGLRLYQF